VQEQPNQKENRKTALPQYAWVGVGVAIGAGVGVAMDNIPLGAAIGVAIGAVASVALYLWKRNVSKG
jgi:hypothetical protein